MLHFSFQRLKAVLNSKIGQSVIENEAFYCSGPTITLINLDKALSSFILILLFVDYFL